jgi:hypothetical protein
MLLRVTSRRHIIKTEKVLAAEANLEIPKKKPFVCPCPVSSSCIVTRSYTSSSSKPEATGKTASNKLTVKAVDSGSQQLGFVVFFDF